MDLNGQKEAFQSAYVRALAAQAGFNVGGFDVDDDSVDLSLRARNFVGARNRSPIIEFQLKCSSQDLISGPVIKFELSRKNYDDLRGTDQLAPRYLAVLLVPPECGDWVVHHDGHIALHNRCFWLSLRHFPPTTNRTSVIVDVPLAQRLTTETLREMMKAASNGGAL